MKRTDISPTDNGMPTDNKCSPHPPYVRFTDSDIEELIKFGYDLGYLVEPEEIDTDAEHPIRFKVISKANPGTYGWISKVTELKNGQWQDAFLYGFYRHGAFRNKYPITFNVQSCQMRGILRRKTQGNPRLETYYRTIFGILDLEPPINPLTFVLSWLTACNFSKIAAT